MCSSDLNNSDNTYVLPKHTEEKNAASALLSLPSWFSSKITTSKRNLLKSYIINDAHLNSVEWLYARLQTYTNHPYIEILYKNNEIHLMDEICQYTGKLNLNNKATSIHGLFGITKEVWMHLKSLGASLPDILLVKEASKYRKSLSLLDVSSIRDIRATDAQLKRYEQDRKSVV